MVTSIQNSTQKSPNRAFHFALPCLAGLLASGFKTCSRIKWLPKLCPIVSLVSLWRHVMKTLSPLLAFCDGTHRSPADSPTFTHTQRASSAELWCFFDISPNKMENKHRLRIWVISIQIYLFYIIIVKAFQRFKVIGTRVRWDSPLRLGWRQISARRQNN